MSEPGTFVGGFDDQTTENTNRYWEGRYKDEKAENERLRAALEKIADDTEDECSPFRSLGASGPVKNIARAAILNSEKPNTPERGLAAGPSNAPGEALKPDSASPPSKISEQPKCSHEMLSDETDEDGNHYCTQCGEWQIFPERKTS